MPSLRHPRAFTLIELLVVISIIALLIGILLPVLSSSRTAARRAQCLANQRSIGQAMEIYCELYAGQYFPNHQPVGTPVAIPDPPHEEWYLRLTEVTDFTIEAMKSPADPHADLEIEHAPGDLEPLVSYSISGYLEVVGNRRDAVIQPAASVIVGLRGDEDIEASAGFPGGPIPEPDVHLAFHPWDPAPANWWDELAIERYDGSANYLFADGHVEALQPDDLTAEMAELGPNFNAER